MLRTDLTVASREQDLRPAAAGGEGPRLAGAAAAYAEASDSPSTRRAYHASWRTWEAWCVAHQAVPLPAHPGAVALWLADLAPRRRVSTLSVHLAALAWVHRRAGHAPPASEDLARVWAGIRHSHGVSPARKRALIVADLRRVIRRLPAGLAGTRDAALLLLQFGAALRRSELVAIEIGQDARNRGASTLELTPQGALIRIARSKTDQSGAGQMVAVPAGKTALCPVRALRAWLEASAITTGPLFRALDRHGGLSATALDAGAVARIIKAAVARAGLDPAVYSGHSPRAGHVTSAAAARVPLATIMRQTRHARTDTVMGYIREAEIWSDNSAGGIGL